MFFWSVHVFLKNFKSFYPRGTLVFTCENRSNVVLNISLISTIRTIKSYVLFVFFYNQDYLIESLITTWSETIQTEKHIYITFWSLNSSINLEREKKCVYQLRNIVYKERMLYKCKILSCDRYIDNS